MPRNPKTVTLGPGKLFINGKPYKSFGMEITFESDEKSPAKAAEQRGRDDYVSGVLESANPYDGELRRPWLTGWLAAQADKLTDFADYRKTRELYAKKYTPPGWDRHLTAIQDRRERTLERLAALYPDFPALYAKHGPGQ